MCRERQISFKILAHVIMEADKSKIYTTNVLVQVQRLEVPVVSVQKMSDRTLLHSVG